MGRIKMTNEQKIKFIKENIQIYIDKNPKKNILLVEGWENFDDVKLQELYIKVQNAKRDFDNRDMQKSYNSAVFKNCKPTQLFADFNSLSELEERERQLEKERIKMEQQKEMLIKKEIENKKQLIQKLQEEIKELEIKLNALS